MPYPLLTLELRGILRHDGFELLRVHEIDNPDRLASLRQRRVSGLTAHLATADGRRLAPGTVGVLSAVTDDTSSGLVRLLLPLIAGDTVHDGGVAELLRDGVVIWREPVSPARPSLEAHANTEPAGIVVRWRAEADAPVDVYAVSPDGRSRFRVLRQVSGVGATIPADALPGGAMRIRVRTTAGLREAYADAGEVRLPDMPGTVHIWLERASTPAAQPVSVSATVADSWGRAQPAEHTNWYLNGESSGEGPIQVLQPGPGEHLITARHPEGGEHTVRLTVTPDVDFDPSGP